MVIRRGEIWWADLPAPTGSEPGYRRPVLVIQSDEFNQSRIATVIAVVITSNVRLSQASGNIFMPQRATGLPKDSVANVSQVITLDKNLLTERVGALSATLLSRVEDGLRLAMSL